MATVWRLSAHHKHPRDSYLWMVQNRHLALGWGDTGDLRNFIDPNELSQYIRDIYPDLSNRPLAMPSLWRFAFDVEQGDIVIVSKSGERFGCFRVTGAYIWRQQPAPANSNYFHQRIAEPIRIDADDLWNEAGGVAPGENQMWSFFRCANEVNF